MFVVPAQGPYQLRLQSIAPKFEAVLLHGMHSKLRFLATSHPFRPCVSQQSVAEQTKMVGFREGDRDVGNPGSIAIFSKDDSILPRRQIDVNGATGAGSSFPGISLSIQEFQKHIWQRHVTFVADISQLHHLRPFTNAVLLREHPLAAVVAVSYEDTDG
jgi:hypothetical protein